MNKVGLFEKVTMDQYIKDTSDFLDEDTAKVVYEDIEKPARATIGSAGYDFKVPYDLVVKPNETVKIPTGIRVKIEPGWFLAIFPRSGLGFKYRFQLDNTVGIIDEDYYGSDNQGHIFVKVTNDSRNNKTVELKKGQGFAQGVFLPYGIVEDDDVSEVRNGGFGSTTK